MFVSTSKAGIGMYAVIIVSFLNFLGLDLDEGTLTEAIYAILAGVGAVLWVVGQVMRRDLRFGIFRVDK